MKLDNMDIWGWETRQQNSRKKRQIFVGKKTKQTEYIKCKIYLDMLLESPVLRRFRFLLFVYAHFAGSDNILIHFLLLYLKIRILDYNTK